MCRGETTPFTDAGRTQEMDLKRGLKNESSGCPKRMGPWRASTRAGGGGGHHRNIEITKVGRGTKRDLSIVVPAGVLMGRISSTREKGGKTQVGKGETYSEAFLEDFHGTNKIQKFKGWELSAGAHEMILAQTESAELQKRKQKNMCPHEKTQHRWRKPAGGRCLQKISREFMEGSPSD